ncbi:MAG: hypothetical protein RLZZ15_2514 [Verrucomicrobiota bacterium]|jgi:adenylate cyclase
MTPPAAPPPAESWLELPDGRTFWLRGPCAIGRLPENDLVLDLPALSRRHALLAAEGDGYTISDLHSRNGTFVNRAVITRPFALRDGDEICFGETIVRYRCTRAPAATSAPAPADLAATRRLDHVREQACWLLIVDVVGFTTLNDQLGGEAAARRRQAWITAVRPLIERHGGRINAYLGDAIFAYWTGGADETAPVTPLAALRAIEAWRPASPLAFRVVVHHGPVLFTHGDRGEELTGQDVNFVFRSEKIAKALAAPALLSAAAVRTLGLDGRCPIAGEAGLEGITGLFSFFTPPPDWGAPLP